MTATECNKDLDKLALVVGWVDLKYKRKSYFVMETGGTQKCFSVINDQFYPQNKGPAINSFKAKSKALIHTV